MPVQPKSCLPADVIFHANWWNKGYGLTFNKPFFFDPEVRVRTEMEMRRIMAERFGDLGLGEKDAKPRPVIGPVNLATGFMISALLGCEVRYYDDASPDVICANLTDERVMALEVPDLKTTSPAKELLAMMDALEAQFGYLEGDVNWEGVQNVALDLRGQQLYIDYYENPELARRLLDVIARTIVEFVSCIARRSETTSLSVNRIVAGLDPRINLHSNCSVALVSNDTYEEYLLSHDQYLSKHLYPYGVHHCGNNMDRVVEGYSRVGEAVFFDVGWGSNIRACREALPDKLFSLRLSPVELLNSDSGQVRRDVERLLSEAGPVERNALCCINIDYGTPDENVREIFRVAERYRQAGG